MSRRVAEVQAHDVIFQSLTIGSPLGKRRGLGALEVPRFRIYVESQCQAMRSNARKHAGTLSHAESLAMRSTRGKSFSHCEETVGASGQQSAHFSHEAITQPHRETPLDSRQIAILIFSRPPALEPPPRDPVPPAQGPWRSVGEVMPA